MIVNLLQGLQAGGMERGTLGQARHMLARGHDVRLLLFDRPYRGASGELDPSPLPCHFIQRQPGFDWQFPLRLASCLEKWRPDILHARNDTALFYAALATKLLASPPGLVATFHSLPAGCGALARRANRWACRQCAFRNAVSGELAQRLVLQGWAREVHTITNGVDIDCFHPAGPSADLRRMLGLSPNTRLIGMIARFDDNKRQQDQLEAFARVRSRCAGTALVFAGDG
ncbi:MAG: glycosyltransferase family 4 protein, partial [Acidobacteria bacterium]|nr:glycosyltransferase family 4 protein [Acidobacteriota bacterium]